MKKIIQWFGSATNPHYGRIWALFFVYPLLTALLVQLVVLPYIFPAWHAGDGMLAGGDWYYFHQMAVGLAEKIHSQGWSAWELRPLGQAPAGIAAAIYALTIPKPWTLIPLNAALHATAAMILFFIVKSFLPNWRKAFLTVLPFWLFPSAMIWYTQIHKDGYFIAGALLFLWGWVQFAQAGTWEKQWWRAILAVLCIFGGAGLVWIVRPYGVQMMQGVGIVLAIMLMAVFVSRLVKKMWKWSRALLAIVIPFAVVLAITPLTSGGIEAEVQQTEPTPSNQSLQPSVDQPLDDQTQEPSTEQSLATQLQVDWQTTGWPGPIENTAYSLALTRKRFSVLFPGAASNIDIQVEFRRVRDILAYLPRAAEIAFLAPFPPDWFGQGSLAQNTVMRRVSAFEMTGIYISLALLPLAIWRWWRKPELWIVLIFCTGMMIIYALVVANVGTLYRFRYGFIMTMVAIGIAGGLTSLKRGRKQAKV